MTIFRKKSPKSCTFYHWSKYRFLLIHSIVSGSLQDFPFPVSMFKMNKTPRIKKNNGSLLSFFFWPVILQQKNMALWLSWNWFKNAKANENKCQSVYRYLLKTVQHIKFGKSTETCYINLIYENLRGWLGFSRNEFKTIIVLRQILKKEKKSLNLAYLQLNSRQWLRNRGRAVYSNYEIEFSWIKTSTWPAFTFSKSTMETPEYAKFTQS